MRVSVARPVWRVVRAVAWRAMRAGVEGPGADRGVETRLGRGVQRAILVGVKWPSGIETALLTRRTSVERIRARLPDGIFLKTFHSASNIFIGFDIFLKFDRT